MLIVNVFIDSLNTNSLVAFSLCKANDIVFYILIFKVCILLVVFFLFPFVICWGFFLGHLGAAELKALADLCTFSKH